MLLFISGFMVQSRDATGKVLGTFSSSESSRLMDCSPGKASAVSHKNNEPKSAVQLQWKVPENLKKETKVFFKVTIVEEFDKFFHLTQSIVVWNSFYHCSPKLILCRVYLELFFAINFISNYFIEIRFIFIKPTYR